MFYTVPLSTVAYRRQSCDGSQVFQIGGHLEITAVLEQMIGMCATRIPLVKLGRRSHSTAESIGHVSGAPRTTSMSRTGAISIRRYI